MSANTGRIGYPIPTTAELMAGEDPDGKVAVLLVDDDGNLKVTTGGGGGGDATAANQVLEIAAINKINAQILDFDTGAGTANTVVIGLALPANGGPVAGGTVTNPLHTIVDSGSITTSGLTDTQLRATPVPISGSVTATLAAGTAIAGKVGIDQTTPGLTNRVSIGPAAAVSATLSNVSSSASSVTLLAANAARLNTVIVNDSTSVVYIKFGATASASSYSYRLPSFGILEFPVPMYQGIVDAIWVSANGAARMTEIA